MIATLGVTRVIEREAEGAALRNRASVALAVALHAGLAWFARHVEAPPSRLVPEVTEVSLLPPAPPETPPPAPEPPPPQPAPEPAAAPRSRAKAPAPPKEPPAASAAPLLTAKESAPDPAEPVRFVTDPNGTAFGYGVVARGGTAREGTGAGVEPPPAPAAKPAEGGGVYRGALGRPPRLSAYDPCRGFFPGAAQVDRGDAAVRVTVSADGRVVSVAIVDERPRSQGFGAAARACLLTTRFEPALDLTGHAVVAVAPVTVRFSR